MKRNWQAQFKNRQWKHIFISSSLKKTASRNGAFLVAVFLSEPFTKNQISRFLKKTTCRNILKLFFLVFQMTSYEKNAKIKVIDLEKLWIFVVDNFFIKIILSSKTTFEVVKFEIQIFVNDLGWRNYQYKSCRSWKFMKLCSWQLFHLNSFRVLDNQYMLNLG